MNRVLWMAVLGLLLLMSAIRTGSQRPDSAPPDVLRLSLSAEPPTLDWTLATDGTSIRVIENLMEGLTEYDPFMRPRGAIAERWEVLDGGRRYLFHLRGDVRWSDGRPLTAVDFEYAWKRLLDPKTGAEYAYFLYDVLNAEAYNTGAVEDPEAVGVRALDARTLEVRLEKPVVFFPAITTFTATFPLRRDVVERHGDRWTEPEHLVVCGPFRLSEWRHEYRLILERNAAYYANPPRMDRVIFYVVEEETTALTLYETGDLDRVSLPPVAIPSYRTRPDYRHGAFLRGYYYGFNVKKSPFDRPLVRKAFSMAVDRSAFPRILKGGEIPATSWVPPGMPGFNPKIGLSFDPQEARRLLAEAGYPDGKGLPPVTLGFNTDPTNRLIAENVQAQWKRHLGVQVTLDNLEWKVYLKRLREDAPQVFRLGWGADYPDPDNFLNLFTSRSGNNNTGWANVRYDALIEQAVSEPDSDRRWALYDEAQRILTEEDVPMMPLFVAAQNILIKPYLKGLQLNPMDLLYLKHAWIERG